MALTCQLLYIILLNITMLHYYILMDLTQRFTEGLLNYDLTLDEIQSGKYVYAGGDTGISHTKYLDMSGITKPDKEKHCVCGHKISKNFYIYNSADDIILVLGSCCILKFMPKQYRLRTCRNCKKPHRNIKINQCNDCRKNKCKKCNIDISYPNKRCEDCKKGKPCSECGTRHNNRVTDKCNECRINLCNQCGRDIHHPYTRCSKCINADYKTSKPIYISKPKGICHKCAKTCGENYSECYICKFGGTKNKCIICNKWCGDNFIKCYDCFRLNHT